LVTASIKAIEELQKKLVDTCFEMSIGFRILVTSNELGEMLFSIKLDKQHEGDEVAELGSIKVFIDAVSAERVRGYQLDYRDKPSREFFLLRGK